MSWPEQLHPWRVCTAKILKQTELHLDGLVKWESADAWELKKLVRNGEGLYEDYLSYLFSSVARSDCLRRLTLLRLLDHFFHRSHAWRTHVVGRLQELLRLCCETDPLHHPLPPPKSDASKLKVEAIKIIKVWQEKFSAGYEKLACVAEFLQASKMLDFERASAEMRAERERREAAEKRNERRAEQVTDKVAVRWRELQPEVQLSTTALDNALRLLVPVFGGDDMFKQSTSQDQQDKEGRKMDKTLHGFVDTQLTIVLTRATPAVDVTAENADLVDTVREGRGVCAATMKHVDKLISRLTECGSRAPIIKELIDAKGRLKALVQKVDELNLPAKSRRRRKESDSSGDSEWEDVPEKEVEEFRPPDDVPDYIMEKIRRDVDEDRPGTSGTGREKEKKQKEKEPSPTPPAIPIVPFGPDLANWGEQESCVMVARNNADCHNFWRPPDDGCERVVSSSILNQRVIPFPGIHRKVERACGARMEGDKRCPRRDIERCPLHGLIVERDSEGFPLQEMEEVSTSHVDEREREEEEDYMRDLHAATGQDCSQVKKKKKRRDASEAEATRQRIQARVFSRRSVARVTASLAADQETRLKRLHGLEHN